MGTGSTDDTLSEKNSADIIFGGQKYSADKIFGTESNFWHFCPPNFCPITTYAQFVFYQVLQCFFRMKKKRMISTSK